MSNKMFPIQSDEGAAPHPLWIPWSIAELAYSVYSARYGRGQTLERLGERGGFGPGEMDMFVPDWRERCSELTTLRSRVEELEKQLAAFAPFAGPDGEPRKVLGKLQVTADHCIVGDDLAIELFNEKGERLNTIGNGMARGPVVFCSDTGERFRLSYPFHKCYSTPAAAQSAKESQ